MRKKRINKAEMTAFTLFQLSQQSLVYGLNVLSLPADVGPYVADVIEEVAESALNHVGLSLGFVGKRIDDNLYSLADPGDVYVCIGHD